MKPPGWMDVRLMPARFHPEDCKDESPHIHASVRVRRWHPGFWWAVIRGRWSSRYVA